MVPICSRQLDFGARRAVVAVLIKTKTASKSLQWQVLCKLYGLTPAEARLTVALTQGASVKSYAEANSVSLNTVRTHLKAVMAKTETRSQVDLVRLLLDGSMADESGL